MLNLNEQKHKVLEFIIEEKDIEVITDDKLDFSSHVVTQLKKANRMM